MDTPETQATFGTKTSQTKFTSQKNNKMSNTYNTRVEPRYYKNIIQHICLSIYIPVHI
jgi:hypothetical protein